MANLYKRDVENIRKKEKAEKIFIRDSAIGYLCVKNQQISAAVLGSEDDKSDYTFERTQYIAWYNRRSMGANRVICWLLESKQHYLKANGRGVDLVEKSAITEEGEEFAPYLFKPRKDLEGKYRFESLLYKNCFLSYRTQSSTPTLVLKNYNKKTHKETIKCSEFPDFAAFEVQPVDKFEDERNITNDTVLSTLRKLWARLCR